MTEINDTLRHAVQMRQQIEARERREREQRDAARQDSISQLPSKFSSGGARYRSAGGLCAEDVRQDRAPIRSAHDARNAMIRRGVG
ncbi:hypothetical protein [Roseomonas haemaphysalidis]|uniref:Uncharacterized protein n=1 Tax=Roseomonas haemaphysalidis TaxID=2768162 RepID=A0ABS3KZ03_9PROT|nr:hypothetical protein [Roseomonas haemaphysalidis]MBO1081828.1 hypothetical protein [Roseomonas haemaphysalidis]